MLNRALLLELTSVESQSILRVVIKATKLGAACFLPNKPAKETLEAFPKVWVYPYVGFPDIIASEQSSRFKKDWDNRSQIKGIEKQ